jgi:hypothetical protein
MSTGILDKSGEAWMAHPQYPGCGGWVSGAAGQGGGGGAGGGNADGAPVGGAVWTSGPPLGGGRSRGSKG